MEIIRKDIPGYEGLYYATSDGKIFSYAKTVSSGRQHKTLLSMREKELKQILLLGYPAVTIYSNAQRKLVKVHRLIAIAFLENPENKPTVNHKNGIKTDNRVDNLEWATILENNVHAYKAGLKVLPKGVNSKCSIFTREQIDEIKRSSETRKALAEKYGVCPVTIYRIKSGRRYAA